VLLKLLGVTSSDTVTIFTPLVKDGKKLAVPAL
jgi:hypothetical protein